MEGSTNSCRSKSLLISKTELAVEQKEVQIGKWGLLWHMNRWTGSRKKYVWTMGSTADQSFKSRCASRNVIQKLRQLLDEKNKTWLEAEGQGTRTAELFVYS